MSHDDLVRLWGEENVVRSDVDLNSVTILMGKRGTGPYCITSGCVPSSVLRSIETIHPAGEGTAYFIPQDLLPYFRNIIIHGP